MEPVHTDIEHLDEQTRFDTEGLVGNILDNYSHFTDAGRVIHAFLGDEMLTCSENRDYFADFHRQVEDAAVVLGVDAELHISEGEHVGKVIDSDVLHTLAIACLGAANLALKARWSDRQRVDDERAWRDCLGKALEEGTEQ